MVAAVAVATAMKGAKAAKAVEAAVVAVVATLVLLPSCSCHRRTFYPYTLPTAYASVDTSPHPNHLAHYRTLAFYVGADFAA